MDLTATLAGLAAAVALAGLSIALDRRPYEPGRPWRFPSKLVLALALLAILALSAHLLSLVTGRPFAGRTGF